MYWARLGSSDTGSAKALEFRQVNESLCCLDNFRRLSKTDPGPSPTATALKARNGAEHANQPQSKKSQDHVPHHLHKQHGNRPPFGDKGGYEITWGRHNLHYTIVITTAATTATTTTPTASETRFSSARCGGRHQVRIRIGPLYSPRAAQSLHRDWSRGMGRQSCRIPAPRYPHATLMQKNAVALMG